MTLRKNMIRAFRNTMNPPQLPGSFFVDLSGNAEMLDTLLHWHERKTDFMLNFLCQLAGYEKHWIPQLFSNQKADVYRAMPFIAWLGTP
ncbi:hypothetical protein KDD30_01685 [Photobacterium sp. GJ3]|uniref:hypothetical protein n=1 Tax=Photobacterium sp. GJ3 TaxID=2829502 RepID=UPI001B8B151C|nr:hypothetical protein [Photobacterium sp. GJ3]QUJ67898.1 hypothetical protein KDD30_01685 [Photobacterium sp. GJ3]